MEKVLTYSVLRYSPSALSGERINLGILFAEESTGYHSFYYTQNLGRVKHFDDGLNTTILKEFLRGIEEEVAGDWNKENFSIRKFVKYYINDYKFEKPQAIVYDNLKDTINSLVKTYFRFDFAKEERPSRSDDRNIIANLITTTGVKLRKNEKVKGAFSESITYDIATDNYYVKIFDFDNKDLKRCINTAKMWAWNCDHEKDKSVYIVYRYSERDQRNSQEFSIINRIFSETTAHFVSIDDPHVFQEACS